MWSVGVWSVGRCLSEWWGFASRVTIVHLPPLDCHLPRPLRDDDDSKDARAVGSGGGRVRRRTRRPTRSWCTHALRPACPPSLYRYGLVRASLPVNHI